MPSSRSARPRRYRDIPMRRARLGCCARPATGQAAAPASNPRKSRRIHWRLSFTMTRPDYQKIATGCPADCRAALQHWTSACPILVLSTLDFCRGRANAPQRWKSVVWHGSIVWGRRATVCV